MKVPFTWKVSGWFMVGWSPEFPVGEVRPLHYFGEDLVAYRDESGELRVLEAHCKHLGAHIAGVRALFRGMAALPAERDAACIARSARPIARLPGGALPTPAI